MVLIIHYLFPYHYNDTYLEQNKSFLSIPLIRLTSMGGSGSAGGRVYATFSTTGCHVFRIDSIVFSHTDASYNTYVKVMATNSLDGTSQTLATYPSASVMYSNIKFDVTSYDEIQIHLFCLMDMSTDRYADLRNIYLN